MRRTILVLMLAAMAAMPVSQVSALQKFEQYRILGSEILAVRMGPQQVEDPALLIVELGGDGPDPQTIEFESDGFLDECRMTIENMIGDASSYVQITVHTTADTMNGMLVTECARISIPGY
ncbi:MAG: hypothetical protein RIA09_08105 [Hoeflea sp.]|uniref:hypothetical protein n=1 Tax=Hoeflea sp. TaxID=1940281 RepID=UPI0032EFD0E2